jgi:GNAT superfamily N-acetyltransferase
VNSWKFVVFDKARHDYKNFDCGQDELNQFLISSAARHHEAGISKTWVLPQNFQNDTKDIIAFYTLSHTEIKRENLPQNLAKKLPRYPLPVILIAQFAVATHSQNKGFGKVTLIKALEQCLAINAHLPSYSVVVDALNEEIQNFYEQYGFKVLYQHNHRTRLFLPMKTLEQLFAKEA